MSVFDLRLLSESEPCIVYMKHIDSTAVQTDSLFLAPRNGSGWTKECVAATSVRSASLVFDSFGTACVLFSGKPAQSGTPLRLLYMAKRSTSTHAEDRRPPVVWPGLVVSPNPSTGEVSLRHLLPTATPAPILVYDIRGRVMRSLVAGESTGTLT
ncbi:MAG: hypothetical protein ABIK65_09735 [Candidatus Eisenbacteria bacterium]